MQDTGLIADSCAFSLCSCCKGRGAKTARGQRSEKGMRWKSWIKTDADGWSGLFLFFKKKHQKKPSSSFGGMPPTAPQPTDIQPAAEGRDGLQSICLSVVFFLEIGINAQLTAHQLKLQVYSTLTGREQ